MGLESFQIWGLFPFMLINVCLKYEYAPIHFRNYFIYIVCAIRFKSIAEYKVANRGSATKRGYCMLPIKL